MHPEDFLELTILQWPARADPAVFGRMGTMQERFALVFDYAIVMGRH